MLISPPRKVNETEVKSRTPKLKEMRYWWLPVRDVTRRQGVVVLGPEEYSSL